MVEPINELREIVRPQKEEYLGRREALMGGWVRKASIYFTWLLLHTPVTANQVTLLALLTGVVGCILLGVGGYWFTIAGTMFLLLDMILDHSDGEVARYRKGCSWFGDFLDSISHVATDALMFASISLGIYRHYNASLLVLAFGFSAGTSIVVLRVIRANLALVLSRSPDFTYRDWTKSMGDYSQSLNRGVSWVNQLVFSHRGQLLLMIVLAMVARMDLFLYFYGVVLPFYCLARIWLIYRKWA